MIEFNESDLREFGTNELVEFVGGDIGVFNDLESGVFKIEMGSRGEIEEVSEVKVIDGVFSVESEEELLMGVDEESREWMSEWVCVEMSDGVVNVSLSEESGFDIVKFNKKMF